MPKLIRIVAVLIALLALAAAQSAGPVAAPSVFGEFVGSTPCDHSVRSFLGIPAAAQAELIEWKLVLYQDSRQRAPSTYRLQFRYGMTVPNQRGLGASIRTVDRVGRWRISTRSHPQAAEVYELEDGLSLWKVSEDVLHILTSDRRLMPSDGGWSYTLYRKTAVEPPPDARAVITEATESRTLSPAATGPSLFGIFDGRSPCRGIAQQLRISVDAGCMKAKWRVTLYQDPQTKRPTTYQVESTFHRTKAREGTWKIEQRPPDGKTVYRLAAAGDEAAIRLLRGDENVFFFLAEAGPLVGNAHFSYTLNRRGAR